MHAACSGQHFQDIEHAATDGAGFDLGGRRFTNVAHRQVQAQCHAGERMVAVEHDV